MMENFKKDILEVVEKDINEAIIVVVGDYNANNNDFPKELIGKPCKLKDVIDYFDYSYNTGYGCQECHDIFIFTNKYIYQISEYDGSTSINATPRSPKFAKEFILR